jgi:hypothetical protein
VKIYRLKPKNISRAVVLVTSLAGALLVATINPMAAVAHPGPTAKAGAPYAATHTTPRDTATTRADTTATTSVGDTPRVRATTSDGETRGVMATTSVGETPRVRATNSDTATISVGETPRVRATTLGTATTWDGETPWVRSATWDRETPCVRATTSDGQTPGATTTTSDGQTPGATTTTSDGQTPGATTTTSGDQTPTDTATTTPPAITAPEAPSGVTAIPGDGSAVVSWHAPALDGGSAIEGYVVMARPEMLAKTQGATSARVTGLTNGVSYTFTVIAFNAAGASVPSAVSASVTPAVSSITGITPPAANASAANAAAANAAAANAAAANAAAANAAAVNAAAANTASGPAVVPGGAPSTGAGGAFRSSSIREMGLGALALLLAGSAMLPAIRRRRRV